MTSRVLQFIGKGQVTIPQDWRAALGMEDKVVKATLNGTQIILESIDIEETHKWEVESVLLNDLPKSDKKLILEGRKAYRKGKKEEFLTASEFFKL